MNVQSSFQIGNPVRSVPVDTRRCFNVNTKSYDVVSMLKRCGMITGVDHLFLGLPESIEKKGNTGNIVKNRRVLRNQLYLMNII